MKPLKPPLFWLITIVTNLIFLVVIAIWLRFMIRSLRSINTTPAIGQIGSIEALDTTTFSKIFPK